MPLRSYYCTGLVIKGTRFPASHGRRGTRASRKATAQERAARWQNRWARATDHSAIRPPDPADTGASSHSVIWCCHPLLFYVPSSLPSVSSLAAYVYSQIDLCFVRGVLGVVRCDPKKSISFSFSIRKRIFSCLNCHGVFRPLRCSRALALFTFSTFSPLRNSSRHSHLGYPPLRMCSHRPKPVRTARRWYPLISPLTPCHRGYSHVFWRINAPVSSLPCAALLPTFLSSAPFDGLSLAFPRSATRQPSWRIPTMALGCNLHL